MLMMSESLVVNVWFVGEGGATGPEVRVWLTPPPLDPRQGQVNAAPPPLRIVRLGELSSGMTDGHPPMLQPGPPFKPGHPAAAVFHI